MPRKQDDWRDTGEWIDMKAEAEARRSLLARYARQQDAYGFSGLRAGFLDKGWTDEQLCDLVREAPRGRWEWHLFAAIARAAGCPDPAPADLVILSNQCAAARAEPVTPAPVWPRDAYAARRAEADTEA